LPSIETNHNMVRRIADIALLWIVLLVSAVALTNPMPFAILLNSNFN